MTPAESILPTAAADLDAVGARWALIGGMAVTLRTEPRFTRDVDFAVAVAGDAEAEATVYRLCARGYTHKAVLEQDYLGRMSTVRLVRRHGDSEVVVDLLFASSGIEPEIVAAASLVEVLPHVRIPVATVGHLIAMKTLAGRHQDFRDLEYLIPAASSADLVVARESVHLIHVRGYSRDADVVSLLEHHLAEAGR